MLETWFFSNSLIQDKKEKVFLIDHFKITFIVYSFMLIVFLFLKSSGSIDSGSNLSINT